MIKFLVRKSVGAKVYNRLAFQKARLKSYVEIISDSRRRELYNDLRSELARPDFEYLKSPDDKDVEIAGEIIPL